jgi:hypothetical protein
MLSYFNKAYIISKVGNCVFSGSPSDLSQHLKNYSYQNRCQKHLPATPCDCVVNHNPADSIIKIASSVSHPKDKNVNGCWCQDQDVSIQVETPTEDEEERGECREICQQMTENVKKELIMKKKDSRRIRA